jgi:glycosyltransferase involved in cell wall biosynthesis
MAPQISIVVPVYRSREILPLLHQRIVQAVSPLDPNFELILVEDDGGDGSWESITKLSNLDPRVRGIRLARNYGQHNALLCGIRAAQGEITITLDDDLQNPPEEIPVLLRRMKDGFDVVYGTPDRQQHGLLRNLASRITKLALQEVMGTHAASKVSAYRVFRTRLREAFADFNSPSVNLDVLLTWGTTHFDAVTVVHAARTIGQSGYTVRKLIAHAVNMMTGFSTLPLQIASILGLVFSLFGAGVLVYVIARYILEGSEVRGFPFLASIIAIFSGVQLFALGIIGEYLARMHFRTMNRPPYSVRTATNTKE